MSFLERLVSCDDRSADSLILGCFAALAAMILLSGWAVIANHMDFDAQDFGVGAGAILVGLGGGKFARDNFKMKSDTRIKPAPPEE